MKIFTLFGVASTALAATTQQLAACRYIPGDRGWPAVSVWDRLNTTVGGRLLVTNSLAHSCHDPTYDNVTCATLKHQWGQPGLQYGPLESPVSRFL